MGSRTIGSGRSGRLTPMNDGHLLSTGGAGITGGRPLSSAGENGCALPRVVRSLAAALAVVASLVPRPAVAQAQPPVRTVPFVDLDRYVGDWFEIARFPNRFQKACLGDARATYTRLPDRRIEVVNRCRTADGENEARAVARIVDDRAFTKLKVRFAPAWLSWLPAVWGNYWVIGLAADYSWAVVGEPGREYLWILARTPQLDEESLEAARSAARANGYDVDRLVPTPQTHAIR